MEQVDGYSRMVQAGPFLYCGGTTSVQPDGSVVCEGDSYGQVKYVLEKLIGIVESAGGKKEDIYSVKIYATPEYDSEEGAKAFEEVFAEKKPMQTVLTIYRLTRPTQLVEIELNAIKGSADEKCVMGIQLTHENYMMDDEIKAVKIGPFVYAKDKTVLGHLAIKDEDVVKVKRYTTIENIEQKPVSIPTAVYSEVIVEKGDVIEYFAVEGSSKEEPLAIWGNFDFRKETKGNVDGFAEYVKCGPFLYGGLHHCVDDSGNVVGIGDSEKQESYLVTEFTKAMKEFGYSPEEMVKFKGYYTTDFGKLYGEPETPAYEKLYKPVKPLYTGVYVSKVGQDDEIFEMEMMAIKDAIEEK